MANYIRVTAVLDDGIDPSHERVVYFHASAVDAIWPVDDIPGVRAAIFGLGVNAFINALDIWGTRLYVKESCAEIMDQVR